MSLIKFRNHAAEEYYKAWIELDDKKERLFSNGDPLKWEINYKETKFAPSELVKNKVIAKTLMLPQVNQI